MDNKSIIKREYELAAREQERTADREAESWNNVVRASEAAAVARRQYERALKYSDNANEIERLGNALAEAIITHECAEAIHKEDVAKAEAARAKKRTLRAALIITLQLPPVSFSQMD